MLSNTTARRLRVPGYLVMALMIVQPLVELYIRSAPPRIHSPAWRLSLVGNASGPISAALLGLFFSFAIALSSDDRGVSYLVSSLSALAGVLCLGATGMFALDALQTKNQVQANLSDSYGLATTWIGIKLLLSVVALGALAIAALRSARGPKHSTSQIGNAAAVVGRSGPAAVGVRPATEADSR